MDSRSFVCASVRDAIFRKLRIRFWWFFAQSYILMSLKTVPSVFWKKFIGAPDCTNVSPLRELFRNFAIFTYLFYPITNFRKLRRSCETREVSQYLRNFAIFCFSIFSKKQLRKLRSCCETREFSQYLRNFSFFCFLIFSKNKLCKLRRCYEPREVSQIFCDFEIFVCTTFLRWSTPAIGNNFNFTFLRTLKYI